MPPNPHTGKTNRRAYTREWMLNFRIGMAVGALEKAALLEVKKGKQCALDPPQAGDSEGPEQTPSPMMQISGLGTPADSPALSQPPLLVHPAPAPPSATNTHGVSQPSKCVSKPSLAAPAQHLTDVPVEAPATSQPLAPEILPAQPSRKAVSPASDDGSDATRIVALERRQDQLEKWIQNVERMLKELGPSAR